MDAVRAPVLVRNVVRREGEILIIGDEGQFGVSIQFWYSDQNASGSRK